MKLNVCLVLAEVKKTVKNIYYSVRISWHITVRTSTDKDTVRLRYNILDYTSVH